VNQKDPGFGRFSRRSFERRFYFFPESLCGAKNRESDSLTKLRPTSGPVPACPGLPRRSQRRNVQLVTVCADHPLLYRRCHHRVLSELALLSFCQPSCKACGAAGSGRWGWWCVVAWWCGGGGGGRLALGLRARLPLAALPFTSAEQHSY
jgi:hypothetical protein